MPVYMNLSCCCEGYGIYVDYPPYFGFGKVKDGFGYDPE